MKIKDIYAARHEPEMRRRLAHVYWDSLVIFFGIVVLASLAYGAWEFTRVPHQESDALGLRPQASFTRADLQATLEGFDARADRFEERMIAPAAASDPSVR